MNDTRMVPAAGPSDEEIFAFVHDQYVGLRLYDIPATEITLKIIVDAALSKWGAQTEYDPVKVEALLDIIEQKKFNGTGLLEYAAAVRSSRRQKGRVVEGWAWSEHGRVYFAEGAERPWNGWKARVEILDAPGEESER